MKTNYFKIIATAILSLVLFSCEQEDIASPDQDILNVASSANLSPTTVTTLTAECVASATATASSNHWASTIGAAIDCDTTTGWNSGGWAPAWYNIAFQTPQSFTGLRITSVALPAETQNYTITATRPDNSTVIITDNFTIGDLSNPNIGGVSNKDFDLGVGLDEFKSVKINMNGTTRSWKAIMEVKLIVPVAVVVDTDGDGVPDDEDAFPNDASEWADSDGDGVGDNADVFPNDPSESADSDGDGVGDNADTFPNSNLDELVTIGGCGTGVSNHLLDNGATFNDLIAEAKATAKNHGAYVSAVSNLTNQWKNAGLISGKEKGKIVSCAARDK